MVFFVFSWGVLTNLSNYDKYDYLSNTYLISMNDANFGGSAGLSPQNHGLGISQQLVVIETTHGSPQDWASLALQQVDFSHGQAPGQPPNFGARIWRDEEMRMINVAYIQMHAICQQSNSSSIL